MRFHQKVIKLETMEKQEILAAFVQAEKDWSEPIKKARENYTHWGLCLYFRWKKGYDEEQVDEISLLWDKHKTKSGLYDFFGYGDASRGRAERLEAIRKVINDLK